MSSPTISSQPTWIRIAALPLAVAIFGGLRALAVANDLWMDEFWTVWHLSQLRSVGEIFSRFVHDNNHPLNSLWMYLVMPLQTDWIYRLPSWVGGTAGIWLAAKLARLQFLRLHPHAPAGQSKAAELITAALFGSSYLLIVYSSEARGYGPALGLSLLAFHALLRDDGYNVGRRVVIYWVSIILGVLAHAVVYPWLAAAVVFTAPQPAEVWANGRQRVEVNPFHFSVDPFCEREPRFTAAIRLHSSPNPIQVWLRREEPGTAGVSPASGNVRGQRPAVPGKAAVS